MSMIKQPEILLALEAGIKQALKLATKAAGIGNLRDEATPDSSFGSMKLDFQLEVDSVAFGHDTDKKPTTSTPYTKVIALLLQRSGIQRDAALDLVLGCMRDAHTMSKDAGKALLETSGVAEMERRFKDEVVGKLPRTPVKKSVKVTGAKLHVKSVSVDD